MSQKSSFSTNSSLLESSDIEAIKKQNVQLNTKLQQVLAEKQNLTANSAELQLKIDELQQRLCFTNQQTLSYSQTLPAKDRNKKFKGSKTKMEEQLGIYEFQIQQLQEQLLQNEQETKEEKLQMAEKMATFTLQLMQMNKLKKKYKKSKSEKEDLRIQESKNREAIITLVDKQELLEKELTQKNQLNGELQSNLDQVNEKLMLKYEEIENLENSIIELKETIQKLDNENQKNKKWEMENQNLKECIGKDCTEIEQLKERMNIIIKRRKSCQEK